MSLQLVLRSKTSGLAPGTKAFPSGHGCAGPGSHTRKLPSALSYAPLRWPCSQRVPLAPPPLPPAVAMLPACAPCPIPSAPRGGHAPSVCPPLHPLCPPLRPRCPPRWPCSQRVPPAPPPLPPAVAVLPACALRDPRPSPVVDDLSLTAAVAVVVQNDVAVTTVELSVRGGVHGHFVGTFDSPDLPEQSWAQTSGGIPGPQLRPAEKPEGAG